MKPLFDSSAIFRAIKENKIEFLAGNYTLELARYELGNIIWKDCVLHVKISDPKLNGTNRNNRERRGNIGYSNKTQDYFLRRFICIFCQSKRS
jgi:hypothetical protein